MNTEKLVLLALDMDDNFCDTNSYINHTLITYFTRHGMTERVKQVKELSLYKSTFYYPEDLREYIWTLAIEPGHFMRDAVPTDLVTGTLFSKLRQTMNASGGRLKNVICTHRGFHKDAKPNTQYWLDNHTPRGLISDVHAIKSADYPNKLDFLQEVYPEHNVILLDDNPFHIKDVVQPHDPRVVVYDQINRFSGYANQRTYRGPQDLINLINNKLGLF